MLITIFKHKINIHIIENDFNIIYKREKIIILLQNNDQRSILLVNNQIFYSKKSLKLVIINLNK